jgi:ubiquinone/menaquinone biosynthesis C-methylase UbiE
MIRSQYQGLLEIFHYNRPFYIRTLTGVLAAVTVALWLPLTLRALLLAAAGTAFFWICSSLLVSHYVYDRSAFYSLPWLPACLLRPPARWINIHSGIDDCSPMIASIFPGSEGTIVDIYDPREMTEPSIEQARRRVGAPSATVDWRALPARDLEFDTAFLIFAAHELRHPEARERLFREVARVLRVGGELVLVEHSRDWANFLAFGPGFLHFFSQRTWRIAAKAAGLSIRMHRTVTPFVHVFVFRRLS